MSTTNLNIRTDKEIKETAEKIYSELGLNMSTAVNMFLRASIRENGIPFELKLDIPNEETLLAIEEAKRIAKDNSIKGFNSIEDLRNSLEI
ncbi:type II toxin-antitoxin system RelB/DinJ family antitoxin [Peptoniphilus sp. MSJ-1]|uniref:Type II toxin-antitoxin system RelB/DinJ family antitoxin n=1 Tax=Peptoniphilus ovalis TaxID=2841503 RepID=A0ABS6FGL2_9FIRM|nr:type II toxin-antitoxin system RelB/DinJ family antitoxin [Peptoniphilus ovalis]MBU5668593.1 type II toxin-antitoxin system RelB/DinJ family antitoxin [Peptoniphilus ovalis]